MTGRSQQMLHANGKSKQTLRVRYDNRPLEDFDYFIAHFNAMRGTHTGFELPERVMYTGWNKATGDKKRLGLNLRWRYSKEPRIRSQRGMVGTIEIELETVGATDSSYVPASISEDCLPCPPPPISEPQPPITPAPPPDGDPGSDPGNGPPGGGSGGDSGGDSGGGGNSGNGPDGGLPAPSPGPGDPAPEPLPECPYGFIRDADGTCIPNPEQKGAYVRVYDWVNTCKAAYARDIGLPQCTKREGPIGPAETWTGFSALGTYTIATTYKEESQALEVSPNAFWEWPDGDRTGQSRTQGNGESITWTCYAAQGNATIPLSSNIIGPCNSPIDWGMVGHPYDRDCVGSTYVQGSLAGNTATGTPNIIFLPDNYEEQMIRLCGKWTQIPGTAQAAMLAYRFGGRTSLNEREDTQPWLADPCQYPSLNRSSPTTTEPRATTTSTSNYFPNISPSRRRIVFGDYEVDRYGSDQEVTMPLPSTAQKNDVVMQLVYANRRDEIARMFMDHYDQCSGEFYDFPIAPVNEKEGTFAGWDDSDTRKIRQGLWIYARPPRIDQTAIGHSTTTIQILNLAPELIDAEAGSGSGGGSGPDGPTPSPSPGPGDGAPDPEPIPYEFDPQLIFPDTVDRPGIRYYFYWIGYHWYSPTEAITPNVPDKDRYEELRQEESDPCGLYANSSHSYNTYSGKFRTTIYPPFIENRVFSGGTDVNFPNYCYLFRIEQIDNQTGEWIEPYGATRFGQYQCGLINTNQFFAYSPRTHTGQVILTVGWRDNTTQGLQENTELINTYEILYPCAARAGSQPKCFPCLDENGNYDPSLGGL